MSGKNAAFAQDLEELAVANRWAFEAVILSPRVGSPQIAAWEMGLAIFREKPQSRQASALERSSWGLSWGFWAGG